MASNNIGNLSIIISGNAGGLTAALSSAQKQVANFRKQASAALSGTAFSVAPAGWGRPPLPPWAQKLVGAKVPKYTVPPPQPGLFATGLDWGKSIVGGISSAFSVLGSVGSAIGGFFGSIATVGMGFAAAAGTAIKHMLTKAMDFQDLLVSFEVMTGSAAKGREMLETLERFSATLPFTSGTVMKAARTLAGNGVAMENVLPSLQALATVVSATGGDDERFGNMVLAFSQVTSMGKLMGQELRQLNDAGFTINHIAKSLGVEVGDVRREMEFGAISAGDIYRAFNMATREGGKFDGLLTRMSGTTRGQFRRLESEFSIITRKIGEGFRQAIENSGALQFLFGALAKLDEHIPSIVQRISEAGPFLKEMLIDLIDIVGRWLESLQGTLQNIAQTAALLPGLMRDTSTVFNAGWEGFKSLFTNPESFIDHELEGGRPQLVAVPTMRERGEQFMGMAGGWWETAIAAGSRAGMDFGKIHEPIAALSGPLKELRDQIRKTSVEGFGSFDKFIKKATQIAELANIPAGGPRFAGALGGAVGAAAVGNPNQITRQQADWAFREQFLDLEKGMDKFKDDFPKAMMRGSTDAASAINHALYQTGQEDIQTRILRVLEAQKAAQIRALEEAKQMGDFFRRANIAAF